MAGQLQDRVAIVTGAGGPKGIGRAIALAYASEGAHVAIAGGRAAAQVAEEVSALGRGSLALATDVSDPEQVQAMVAQTKGRFGRIDVLVNNAGILLRGCLFETTLADWERTLAVNLTGVFLCCQAVGREMVARGVGGRIINVSSGCAHTGCPTQLSYAASKGGVEGMTMALARDLAEYGIAVNAISPGGVYTSMTSEPPAPRQPVEWSGEPIPRMGLPEDVAGAAVFLASEAANWVTGISLIVDGGLLVGA